MANDGKDLKAVFDGMRSSLVESIASPPWRHRRNTGQWPERDSAELELIDQQISDRFDDSQIEVNDGYGERRADIRRVVDERKRRLDAYAGRTRQVIAPEEGKFIFAGRITDQASGVGLPNVRVSAFDLDRSQHDHLGNARTDALGYFRIEYTEADYMDRGEEQLPETYIEVFGEDGSVIHTSSKSFVQKAGEAQFLKVELDGSAVSKSLDAGRRVDESVKLRLDGLDTRARVLAVGDGAALTRKPAARMAGTNRTGIVSKAVSKAATGKTASTRTKPGKATKAKAAAAPKKAARTSPKAAAKTRASAQAAAKATATKTSNKTAKASAHTTKAAAKSAKTRKAATAKAGVAKKTARKKTRT